MKIDQSYAMNEIMQRQDTTNKTENEKFASLLAKSTSDDGYTVVKSGVSDIDVDLFLDQLTSMGASAFWLNFNLEKIQDMIEAKRQEYSEKLGLNDESISDDDRQSALKELDDMIEDYIKDILKQTDVKSSFSSDIKNSPLIQILSENLG